MKNKICNLLIGLAFVAAGVLWAGDAFGFWNFSLFFSGWWTLFIIVPSLVSIIKSGPKVFNLICFIIGGLLLCNAQIPHIFSWSIISRLIFPIILVVVGVVVLCRGWFNNHAGKVKNTGPKQDYAAVFSGQNLSFPGADFHGANLTAVFGGIELDLRQTVIQEDIVIHATAVFGGVDLFVPPNVKVKLSSVPIFGGASNKTQQPIVPDGPTVYVDCVCIFGGVDVK